MIDRDIHLARALLVESNPLLRSVAARITASLRGTDIVPGVVSLCAMNLYLHGIGSTADANDPPVDRADALAQPSGRKFDMILANPPYVEDAAELDASVRHHEPAGALFAGPEGLDDYRVLIPQLPGLLTENGIALVEIGHTQAKAVGAIATAAGRLYARSRISSSTMSSNSFSVKSIAVLQESHASAPGLTSRSTGTPASGRRLPANVRAQRVSAPILCAAPTSPHAPASLAHRQDAPRRF